MEVGNGGLLHVDASFGPVGGRECKPSEGSPFRGGSWAKDAEVAYNPYAPIDEVQDASSRLSQIYNANDVGIDTDLYVATQQFAMVQQNERKLKDMVAKAIRLKNGDVREDREGKAETSSWGSEFGRGYFRWFLKQGVQFPILRAFGRRIEVHQAILRTRLRQVERFSRPSRYMDQMGWRLIMRDEDAPADESIKEEIKWLTQVLACGGREFDPIQRRILKQQGFKQFLRFLVHDAIELDNAAVELIRLEGAHGLDSWKVRPSETFALANPQYAEQMTDGRDIYAYQVLNGRAEIPFAHDELAIWIRNASTWTEENGYGFSEFEQTLDTLNNIIQSIVYTKQGIADSAIPKGILMLYGNYERRTQEQFKAAWNAKVRGVSNQFNLPVLFSRNQQGDAKYVTTGQPFDEMAFKSWIAFNWTVASAIYGVSPEEVGMEGFTPNKSSLSGDDTVEKLASAKDKGLYPLLKDASSFISDEILYPFTNRIVLEFTGLDSVNSEERFQEKIRMMTVNERRAMYDMPAHPLGWFGDLPADESLLSAEFQRLQATMTFGEGRKMWGQLPEYPSSMVNETPLNPSMGAVFMQALMSKIDQPGGEEGYQDNGGAPPDNETDGEEDQGPDHKALDTIHGRMASLALNPPRADAENPEKVPSEKGEKE